MLFFPLKVSYGSSSNFDNFEISNCTENVDSKPTWSLRSWDFPRFSSFPAAARNQHPQGSARPTWTARTWRAATKVRAKMTKCGLRQIWDVWLERVEISIIENHHTKERIKRFILAIKNWEWSTHANNLSHQSVAPPKKIQQTPEFRLESILPPPHGSAS